MNRSTATNIDFKGIREGLLLTLGDAPGDRYEVLVEQVHAELVEKQEFLQGSRVVVDVGGRPLAGKEIERLQALLAKYELTLWALLAQDEGTKAAARSLGLGTRLAGSSTDLEGNRLAPAPAPDPAPAPAGNPLANALLLRETIRSGQSIFHEGHVVIIGDVNPGAEIVATGNVVVWGRLRGLVHAGVEGDERALICALELLPTQLRIANQIAIPPDERDDLEMVPERASIRDGQIVADPWRTRE